MNSQQYGRYYDRSVELFAIRKHRKLSKRERDELAFVCLQMFEAQMARWHAERERQQAMPTIRAKGIN